jgi:hypothetical protein
MRLQVLVAWMFLVAVPLRVGALTVLPATFEELVHESTAVVYGRVVSVEGRWTWDRRTIESVVTLDAVEHFKGTTTELTTFTVPGGEAGGRILVVPGAPSFRRGDAVVVFLSGRAPAMPAPVGLSLGVYRVSVSPQGGGPRVLPTPVRGGAPAGLVARGSDARRVRSLAEFAADVRAVGGRQ